MPQSAVQVDQLWRYYAPAIKTLRECIVSQKIRPVFAVISLILAGLFFVAVAEVGLRLLAHFQVPASPMFVMDDKIGIRLRPGLTAPGGIVINEGGFNDREPAEPHPTAVFVGDSFTFGTAPWQNVFPHLVEKELADRGFRVVNAGVPITGPQEYRRVIEHVAVPLQPAFIVVTIFIGNDIGQSEPGMQTLFLLGSGRVLQPPHHVPSSWRHSYVLLAAAKAHRKLERAIAGCSGEDMSITNDFLRDVYQAELSIYARKAGGRPEAVEALLGHISEMNDRIIQAGSRALFVLAPSEIQLNETLRTEMLGCLRLAPAAFDFDAPQAVITEALRNKGIAHVDLLPVMTPEAKRMPLYNRFDTHWNLYGNRIAAKVIADTLRPHLYGR